MATVLTLSGAFKSYNLNNFGGSLFKGNQVRKIGYPAIPSRANAATGVNMLDEALKNIKGDIIVAGHSLGAQIIYKWLREVAPLSKVDPSRVLFVSSGNLERKYGGTTRGGDYPGGKRGQGTGLPDDTRYRVLDVARQYDVWCDRPATSTALALENLDAKDIHSKYADCTLENPENITFIEGNVTYMFCPTFPLPMVDKWYYRSSRKLSEDRKYRPQVELAYKRPFGVRATY